MPTSAYAVCTNPMPQENRGDACLHEAVGEGRDDGPDVDTGSPAVAPQGRGFRASPHGP